MVTGDLADCVGHCLRCLRLWKEDMETQNEARKCHEASHHFTVFGRNPEDKEKVMKRMQPTQANHVAEVGMNVNLTNHIADRVWALVQHGWIGNQNKLCLSITR